MSFVRKQSNEISPLNPPTSGSFSFSQGFPILTFQISEMPQILIGKSMKLNGTLRVRTDSAGNPDNFNARSTGEKSGTISNRSGVYGCIDQLTVSTLQNQTMEHIRHYGRYVSNVTNMTRSPSDMDLNQGVLSLMSSRSGVSARGMNVDRSFSMPVVSGVMSNNFSLGRDGSGGLILAFQLSPDNMALSGYYNASGSFVNNTSNGWTYEISDVTLSFETLVPTPEMQQAMMTPRSSAMEFTSISNIYSDITSSDATINLNLNSSRVLDIQTTFLPTTQINNYANDSFTMPRIQTSIGNDAIIKRVSYLRGSTLYPFVDELQAELESNEGRTLTEIYIPSMNAFENFENITSTSLSNQSENKIPTSVNQVTGKDDAELCLTDSGVRNFSISCSTDPYDVGLPFKETTYGLRVVSNLPGTFSNGCFTYVKSLGVLQRDAAGAVMVMV